MSLGSVGPTPVSRSAHDRILTVKPDAAGSLRKLQPALS